MKTEYTETPSTCPYCLVDGKALLAQVAELRKALEAQQCWQCEEDEPDYEVCDACRLKRAALEVKG